MTITATAPTAHPAPAAPPRGVLPACCAAVIVVLGMVAAVNLAVPMLAASELHPSSSALVWIVDLYVIVFACLVIPGGAAGDRYGRKGVMVTGLGLFAAGALLSALAPSVVVLLLGRALTGVGAAAVLPNSLGVLVHAVAPERRPRVVAVWASMSGIAGVVGNIVGGAVLSGGSWRWLFLAVVVPAVLIAGWLLRVAPVSPRHDRGLDPAGTVLLVGASLALLFGIVQGPEEGWGSAVVVGGFVAAAVLGVAWAVVELRVAQPLLDPRLFRIPALRSACLGMVGVFFGMFAMFYVNASFLQYAKGFGVVATGLAIMPVGLVIVVFGRRVGLLVDRVGAVAVTALAFACVGGGLLGLSTSSATTSYPAYAAWLLLLGVGIALALPTLSVAIAGSLPPAQAGVGAGLQATTREFGSALGVAVIGTVLTARFVAALPRDVHARTVAAALGATRDRASVIEAFVRGVDDGLRVVGLAVLVIGALVVGESVLARRRPTLAR